MEIEMGTGSFTRRRIEVLTSKPEGFSILICALGYESRCTHAAKLLEGRVRKGVSIEFPDRRVLSYPENKDYFINKGFQNLEWNDPNRLAKLAGIINSIFEDQPTGFKPDIAIDVSSMTREMAAELIHFFCSVLSIDEDFTLSVLYAPGRYSPPVHNFGAIKHAGAVTPDYAGWTEYPEDPNFLIVGLGYEYGRALGAHEFLDVSGAWILLPVDDQGLYLHDVIETNKDILKMCPPENVIRYRVRDPDDTFVILKSLVQGLQRRGKLILLPFGPKILNALMLLLAEIMHPSLSVWRISGGDADEAEDRLPDEGGVVQFSIRIYATRTECDDCSNEEGVSALGDDPVR